MKAKKQNPFRNPDQSKRSFFVTTSKKGSISPKFDVQQVPTKNKESTLWQVIFEVDGSVVDYHPTLIGHSMPVHRLEKRSTEIKSNPGYIPEWVDVSIKPKVKLKPEAPRVRLRGANVDPYIVFPDDGRQTLYDTSYPWHCIGKVKTSQGWGSGVLVGDRIFLTARHVIPQPIEENWLTFSPAYFNGDSPNFGSSYATNVGYYGTDDDEYNMSHDYAVVRLNDPLGNWFGYLGSTEFNDSWRGISWDQTGYHQDFLGGEVPAWQKYPIEDDYEDDDGQILETEASLEHGSSGSPFFGWFDGGNVRLCGVVGGGTSFDGDMDNRLSGGSNLVNLIDWARANWPL